MTQSDTSQTSNARRTRVLNFEPGDRLRSSASLIAAATLERDYAQRPFLLDRYGENGRTKYREDILYNVSALSAAVDADDSAMFLRYVEWLKIVLVNRGVASDDIAESLRCMASALADDVVGDHSQAASDVLAALEEIDSMPDAVPSFINPSREEHDVAQRCLAALLGLDAVAGREVLENALAAGMPLARIYTGILPPLMREIGRLWQMNKISVAHEHYCSAAVQSILGGFYGRVFSRATRSGRSMLVACVACEQHELGGRMLADVFELDGWRTSFLGANLPPRELIALIQQAERPPDLIALSATMPAHLKQLASTIESIRDSSNVPVMVGGYLFNGCPGLAAQLGADGSADDAEPAIAIANALVARAA
jgi:methanogenic corrinoid protein MtbC1